MDIDQVITNILNEDLVDIDNLDIKQTVGKIIVVVLDDRTGDRHGYYIDDQHRLWISYPSGYYAMDRQVTEDSIMRLLRGLSGDSSVEEISEAIANSYAV